MAISSRRLLALGLILCGLSLAATAFLVSRPGDGVTRGRHSVLLITLDTTRADHLAPYGGDIPVPALAELARTGVVFDQAYAVAPITLVAHTSLLTGLWPPQTGVRNNGIHAASDELSTLAERLLDRGYRTAAFVSAAVLEKRYGLDQGFEVYDDDLSSGLRRLPRMVPDRPAAATVDSVLGWLEGLGEKERFFAWVHFYDPHAPYLPPSPHREAWPGRPYDGEIAYLDSEIGRLLRHPRLAGRENLITAVIGDHGESLGEHGEQTHALLAHDATLRVPFFLRWPGGPQGARIQAPVSQVDLLPTLLDLLGLPAAGEAEKNLPGRKLPGQSLVPRSARSGLGSGGEGPRLLYAETYLPHYTYGWAKLRTIRRGTLKYIDSPRPELFDLRLDPRELSNIVAQQSGAAHDLARDLEEFTQALGGADRESSHRLDAESEAELRSLGYLAAGPLPQREGAPPHPKDQIEVHTGLERARLLQADALYDLAALELEKVLAQDPVNLAAYVDLAENLASQGDLEAASESVQKALALDPSSARLHLQLAMIEGRRQRFAEALALVERSEELAPGQVDTVMQRIFFLRALDRSAEAAEILMEGLESHPDHPRLLTSKATLVLAPAGRLAEAEAALRLACERDPFLASAHRRLGELLEKSGRRDEALELYGAALGRRPRDAGLQARFGLLLARRGDPRAEEPLREAIRLSPRPRSDLFLTLAGILASQQRGGEAREAYERLASRQVEGPRERNNRAIALLRLGRLPEARRELETLGETHPRSGDILANLAAVSAEMEDWPAAEKYARRLIEVDDGSPDAWNNLGVALKGLGQVEEARRAYRQALELDAEYWQARVNLEELEGGP